MVMHKIKSSFFSKMDNNTDDTESERIIYKGVKTIEDVNGVKLNKGEFKYNRGAVMSDLMHLKQFSNVPIQSLKKDTLNKFYEMIKINDNLKNDSNLRETFLKDVKKIFTNLENVKPGTVGAVFLDCGNNFECDPLCEKSIFKDDTDKQCNQIILLYLTEDKDFKPLNTIQNSDNCYIYVDSKKNQFKGFSKENIQFLKNNYQSSGYVLLFSDFDKNKTYPQIPLNKLPVASDTQQVATSKDVQPQELQQSVNMNNVFIVLLILLIILIIVGIAIYAYQDRQKHSEEW